MAVFITDICINCAACIDECPVEAIVDEDDKPNRRRLLLCSMLISCVEWEGNHDTTSFGCRKALVQTRGVGISDWGTWTWLFKKGS